jgi:general secretion pathway protein G
LKSLLQSQIVARTQKNRCRRVLAAGFTLIELMIVITIMLILIGMAAANYGKFIQRANEAVLKHNLRTMREMIDHYTVDKQSAPHSLEDLSQAGYLRDVPVDPITRRKEWTPRYDLVFALPDQASVGIVDVSSKSTGTALDGTKYSEW